MCVVCLAYLDVFSQGLLFEAIKNAYCLIPRKEFATHPSAQALIVRPSVLFVSVAGFAETSLFRRATLIQLVVQWTMRLTASPLAIGVGRAAYAPPPSEPDMRISRIRLSS
jgi:hypothetical protein